MPPHPGQPAAFPYGAYPTAAAPGTEYRHPYPIYPTAGGATAYPPQPGSYFLAPALPYHTPTTSAPGVAPSGTQVALPAAHHGMPPGLSYYYGGYSAAYPYSAAGRIVTPVLALGVFIFPYF